MDDLKMESTHQKSSSGLIKDYWEVRIIFRKRCSSHIWRTMCIISTNISDDSLEVFSMYI